MKKIIFLPILLMMPLVACGEGDEAPETPTNWSVDIKAEMNDNIGEVLPYVSFGEGFYHSWTASSSVYSIGDTSSVNVLSGYGTKLEAKGWVEYNSKDEITYKKQNDKGYLTLKATYSSGNKITVTVRDSEDIDPVGEEWPEAVKSQMLQYLGEVLPYAPLDESTLFYELYYEYTMDVDDVDGYNWYIQDDNANNVLSNYGEKLIEAGFTYGTDTYGDPVYYKAKTNGDELDIYFDWYPEETDSETGEVTPAGNQIDCYFYRGEGGDDPTPTSGSVEIVIGSIPGYAHDTEFGTVTVSPGVTISAEKGNASTAPRFWTNGSEKQFRIYAGSTMTISAEGITKIEFTWTTKNSPTLSAATGTMSGTTWTGSASSIKFTVGGSGHLRITKIVVYGEFDGSGDTPSGDVKSVSSIAEDIAEALEIESSSIQYQDGAALLGVAFNDVTSLEDACEAGCSVLDTITYLTFDDNSGIAPDTWQDGSEGYFAYYLDEDYESNGLVVEVGTFLDDGDYVTQFCVYVEEE